LMRKLTDKLRMKRTKLDKNLLSTESNNIRVLSLSTESRDLPSMWCHLTRPQWPQLTSSLITTTTLPDKLTTE
jgi:hypothetical protein